MSRHFGSVMVSSSVGFRMRASTARSWAGFALVVLEKKCAL
jgi:hypothetical protein